MPASKLPSCVEPLGGVCAAPLGWDAAGVSAGSGSVFFAFGWVIRLSVLFVFFMPAIFFFSGMFGQILPWPVQQHFLAYPRPASRRNRADSSGGVGLI